MDNKEIKNEFNKFYVQVAKNLNNKLTNTYTASLLLRKTMFGNIINMKAIHISEVEVKNIIIYVKSKNSTEFDGTSNKIVKYCINYISKSLTHICDYLLTTGIFP